MKSPQTNYLHLTHFTWCGWQEQAFSLKYAMLQSCSCQSVWLWLRELSCCSHCLPPSTNKLPYHILALQLWSANQTLALLTAGEIAMERLTTSRVYLEQVVNVTMLDALSSKYISHL